MNCLRTDIDIRNLRTARRIADAYTKRPPVSTKYVKAFLLGSPGLNWSWLLLSYLYSAQKAQVSWVLGFDENSRQRDADELQTSIDENLHDISSWILEGHDSGRRHRLRNLLGFHCRNPKTPNLSEIISPLQPPYAWRFAKQRLHQLNDI